MYPVLSLCFFLFEMRVNLLECNFPGYTLPLISYWNCFTLYMQQASVLLFDMLYNLAWLGPCFSGLVLAILIFSSLPDINTTLTFSCPFVSTWHCSVDSAGVLDSTECGVFFLFFFSAERVCCYSVLTCHKNGETAVYSDNPSLLRFYRSHVYVLQN